jgi:hypothetical protein
MRINESYKGQLIGVEVELKLSVGCFVANAFINGKLEAFGNADTAEEAAENALASAKVMIDNVLGK